MGQLKFYADLKSQPCRAVYIFLKANNIPFQMIKVDLFTGEQLQPDFTKVSPIQRVPVIDDGGFVLGESGAIFRYLSRKYNVADHWYPAKDLEKQAKIDEYLNWHHTNTRMNAMMTFRHQFLSTIRGKPVKQDEVARFKDLLNKTVNHIDKYFLNGHNYIGGGNDVSVADVQALCELMQLAAIGDEALYRGNANVKAWEARVVAKLRPYFEDCDEQGLSHLKQMYQSMAASKL